MVNLEDRTPGAGAPAGTAVLRLSYRLDPDDVLGMYPISTRVNNVRNQGPELLGPMPEAPPLPLED